MKKTIIFLAVLCATITANAQDEIYVIASMNCEINDDMGYGKAISQVEQNETLKAVDYNFGYITVEKDGKKGYLNIGFVEKSELLDEFVKVCTLRNNEKRQQENAKNKAKQDSISEAKAKEYKEQLELLDAERELLDAEIIKAGIENQKRILKKYGTTNGTKILKGLIWLGMTDDMAIESWGKPEDINRTVGSWGTHEQWVYGNDQYLYFENGVLKSYQN